MYVFVKIIVSAILIGIVTEVSRRYPSYGGIIAALPLVSLLSIIWLYVQGEQNSTLSRFIVSVLFGFPATAVLLLIVFLALKQSIHLFVAIGLGIGGWFVCLFVQEYVIRGIKSFLF